jgi:hypothetical protein
LDEVLIKAEKLEASSSGNVGAANAGLRQNGVLTRTTPGETAVEENGSLRKTKTLKSVAKRKPCAICTKGDQRTATNGK